MLRAQGSTAPAWTNGTDSTGLGRALEAFSVVCGQFWYVFSLWGFSGLWRQQCPGWEQGLGLTHPEQKPQVHSLMQLKLCADSSMAVLLITGKIIGTVATGRM